MASAQLEWTETHGEIRRKIILTAGWIAFLLATPALLFVEHLPRWAGDALVVGAVLGGAAIMYGELSLSVARWKMVARR
jgi:hypothetical protein